MSLAPGVGVVDNSTQFLPVGIARHGAVGAEDKVGRCILKHLVDSSLSLFNAAFGNYSQTLQTTEDRENAAVPPSG